MIQVIQRKDGERAGIATLQPGRPQISYNSDGHLCIRIIHDKERDTLFVLDKQTSRTVIDFIRKDELPF